MPVGTGVSDVRRLVRRLLLLATFALMASLFLAPTAGAQEMMQEKMMDDSMMMEKGKMDKGKMEMPKTGGPATLSMLLPAAATLLLGSGVLTYSIGHNG
jgi:hypothetical protein